MGARLGLSPLSGHPSPRAQSGHTGMFGGRPPRAGPVARATLLRQARSPGARVPASVASAWSHGVVV